MQTKLHFLRFKKGIWAIKEHYRVKQMRTRRSHGQRSRGSRKRFGLDNAQALTPRSLLENMHIMTRSEYRLGCTSSIHLIALKHLDIQMILSPSGIYVCNLYIVALSNISFYVTCHIDEESSHRAPPRSPIGDKEKQSFHQCHHPAVASATPRFRQQSPLPFQIDQPLPNI